MLASCYAMMIVIPCIELIHHVSIWFKIKTKGNKKASMWTAQ